MESTTNGATIEGAHCENCGSQDYEDLNCGDQGYTACCNELVCMGPLWTRMARHGTPEKNVRACCWAAAERAGILEGSRLD